MSTVNLIPAPYRMAAASALVLALLTASVAATWQIQDWRYGSVLAKQALQHNQELDKLALAANDRQRKKMLSRTRYAHACIPATNSTTAS